MVDMHGYRKKSRHSSINKREFYWNQHYESAVTQDSGFVTTVPLTYSCFFFCGFSVAWVVVSSSSSSSSSSSLVVVASVVSSSSSSSFLASGDDFFFSGTAVVASVVESSSSSSSVDSSFLGYRIYHHSIGSCVADILSILLGFSLVYLVRRKYSLINKTTIFSQKFEIYIITIELYKPVVTITKLKVLYKLWRTCSSKIWEKCTLHLSLT